VDVKEGMDLLQQSLGHNLVQFGENVRQKVAFICNCCGCCCEALLAAKRFAVLSPIATTDFLPEMVDRENCNGCGKCVEACPVEAMGLVSAGDPRQSKRKQAKLQPDLCLGCGVCVRTCARNVLSLRSRERRLITPVTAAHRTVLMAIERGKLQNLIFDNQAHWNHRAMAAILGAILKLPPNQTDHGQPADEVHLSGQAAGFTGLRATAPLAVSATVAGHIGKRPLPAQHSHLCTAGASSISAIMPVKFRGATPVCRWEQRRPESGGKPR
jgi:Na+-translocating ferredoxin:NAD+ oxidoreductase RNF subunit RnfB